MAANEMGKTHEFETVRRIETGAFEAHPANRQFPTTGEDMASLVASVRKSGILVPVICRRHPQGPELFQLLSGHRRHFAATAVGLESVPAIVREMDDAEAAEFVVCENMQRVNLTPLEEADGILALQGIGRSFDEIADRLGRSAKWVARRAQLVRLTEAWRKAIADPDSPVSVWHVGLLEQVAALPEETQAALLEGHDLEWLCRDRNLTARDLAEHLSARYLWNLAAAKWRLEDATLVPKAGSCVACQERTAAQPLLFAGFEPPAKGTKRGGGGAVDRCLNPRCWQAKLEAFLALRVAELRKEHKQVLFVNGGGGYTYQEQKKLEKRYGKVLAGHEVTPAAKSDKRAVPAITVTGDKAGEVRWVRKVTQAEQSRSAGHAVAVKKPAPTARFSLKELRKQLECRRARWIAEELQDRLDELVEAKKFLLPDGIARMDSLYQMAIVAAFGSGDFVDTPACRIDEDPWKAFEELVNRSDSVLIRNLILRGALKNVSGDLSSCVPTEECSRMICGWVGLDAEELAAKAAKEIPEPKEWAGLNADGTPKTIKTGNRKGAQAAEKRTKGKS